MDLIYMNSSREDVGVLMDYELDLAFGADENNFECRIQSGSHCCESGFFLYMDGTEYGGIIDGVESDTASKEVIYSGRTWHGILNSKVIQPDAGEDYLILSGEANAIIAELLSRLSLTDLFEASSDDSGMTISNYQMNRYIMGYAGICKMLSVVGGRLAFSFANGKVVLSAVAIHDYSTDEEFDSDQMDFHVKQKQKTVNHLVCLGSGDLAERTVIHLYADTEGNISKTQTQFGLDEYAAVYDYGNAESEEELENSGIEKLTEMWEPTELSIDFDVDTDLYAVGDIVGAIDNITGISVSASITKKIVTIKNGQTTISYKVGE